MITQSEQRNTQDTNFQPLSMPQARMSASGSEGSEKLDKVRDILFGNEFRSIDHRFAKTEETIVKLASDLREEFRAHLNSVEEALKTLSDDLAVTNYELRRDKADKLGLAELFEAIAHRLREDHDSMSH